MVRTYKLHVWIDFLPTKSLNHSLLCYILLQIEQYTGASFDSVLCNHYRNGSDHIPYHSDDETEFIDNHPIASASFGASRIFKFKRTSDQHELAFVLPTGILLVMYGCIQKTFQHSVPCTLNHSEPRINLTYRLVK